MKRESFKSRLGFILVSAGCAIGIGNVWRFPYVVGENGGGLFVLLYLVFLIAMGLPVLTMELAVGRASRKSAVLGYKALEKPGSKWHLHGWAAIFGCYMLMMYYTTVSGWMVTYFYKFLTGEFQAGMDAEAAGAVFSNLLADPLRMSFWPFAPRCRIRLSWRNTARATWCPAGTWTSFKTANAGRPMPLPSPTTGICWCVCPAAGRRSFRSGKSASGFNKAGPQRHGEK